MGSMFSGNRSNHPDRRTTVEECLTIDANRWARDGVLEDGVYHSRGRCAWEYSSGKRYSIGYEAVADVRDDPAAPFARLFYSWTWGAQGQEHHADYRVGLTTTRQHLGGFRWWFLCPLARGGVPCGRRIGKLHLPPRAHYFGCRQCHDLTYRSCQEAHQLEAMYKSWASGTGMTWQEVRRLMRERGY